MDRRVVACAAADASRARSRAAPRVAIGVLHGLPLHGVRLCAVVLHGLPLRVVRLCARDRRRQSEGAAAEIPARNLRAPFNWRSTGALGCRVTLRRYIVSLRALEPCATPGLPHQKPESNASMAALEHDLEAKVLAALARADAAAAAGAAAVSLRRRTPASASSACASAARRPPRSRSIVQRGWLIGGQWSVDQLSGNPWAVGRGKWEIFMGYFYSRMPLIPLIWIIPQGACLFTQALWLLSF